jgi:hypothetical protein
MNVVGAVRLACVLLGVGILAAGVSVALVALPAPAAGGTCGPGASSEAAIIAFVNPGSIGAGPKPAPGPERAQWSSFVRECQSATDGRMAVAGSLAAGALVLGLGGPVALRGPARRRREQRARRVQPAERVLLPPPGWYPDPGDQRQARWWDGGSWGPTHVPPGGPHTGPGGTSTDPGGTSSGSAAPSSL